MSEEAPGRRPMIERVRDRRERHKQRSRAYRVAFGIAGFVVLLAGIVLSLPLVPGPGLLLVAIALGMLALEFAWAEHLLERIVDRLELAGERAARATRAQKVVIGGLVAAGIGALIAVALLWDVPGTPI